MLSKYRRDKDGPTKEEPIKTEPVQHQETIKQPMRTWDLKEMTIPAYKDLKRATNPPQEVGQTPPSIAKIKSKFQNNNHGDWGMIAILSDAIKLCNDSLTQLKDIKNKYGENLLYHAAMHCPKRQDIENLAIRLINCGFDINNRGKYSDYTPLCWAAYNGNTNLTAALINKGADVTNDQISRAFLNFCHSTTNDQYTEVIKLLVKAGGDINGHNVMCSAFLKKVDAKNLAELLDIGLKVGRSIIPIKESPYRKAMSIEEEFTSNYGFINSLVFMGSRQERQQVWHDAQKLRQIKPTAEKQPDPRLQPTKSAVEMASISSKERGF